MKLWFSTTWLVCQIIATLAVAAFVVVTLGYLIVRWVYFIGDIKL